MILNDFFTEAANLAQQAAIAIAMKKAGKKPKTESANNPADTLYFFDVAQGGRSFNHLDLKILGLRQTKSGKWYYQPGRDSTDLLTNASLKHLEKTLNVPARAWKRPVEEEKVRLDPKCWTGKKIGNPKTKMKGGVRVNNCVPK